MSFEKHTNLPKIFQHPPPFIFCVKLPFKVYMTLSCFTSLHPQHIPFVLAVTEPFAQSTLSSFSLVLCREILLCEGPPTSLFFQLTPFILRESFRHHPSSERCPYPYLSPTCPRYSSSVPAVYTDHDKDVFLVPVSFLSTRPVRTELSRHRAQVPVQSL